MCWPAKPIRRGRESRGLHVEPGAHPPYAAAAARRTCPTLARQGASGRTRGRERLRLVMLTLEVEFLTGVSVAARPNRREQAEWPPHPDRLFQALLAAWGRNEPPLEDERRALEWLEALDINTFQVSAPSAHPRQVATVFVPPNDARTPGRVGDKAPKDIRAAI